MSPKNLNVLSKTHKYLLDNLRDKRIFQIYKKFENELKINQNFIVAVSGGPDSLALSFLTKIYSIKKSLTAKYLLVDHRLRENSSSEANSVKILLRKNNINVSILKWNGKKPVSNIQSLARKKRYNLLTNYAKKFNIKVILTGHHIDDLYENFFLRISRGSGLKGLVSFYEKTNNQNINIIRPLLKFQKIDLVYITKKIFGTYINDPYNEDGKFKRVRIRKLTKKLHAEGLNKQKFLITIKNLKHSNETIKFYTEKNIRNNSFLNKKKNRVLLNKDFFNQPHEITFRSLTEVIKNIGGRYYPVRGKKIDKVINRIKAKTNNQLKLTIGNCILSRVNQSVIVIKEQQN